MAFNDDDWLNYSLDQFTKPESPQANNFFDPSLENIPLDDAGGSPVPDLSYNNDLAVPLEYLGNELRLSPGPNQPGTSDGYNVDNSMHLMQNSSNFDSQMQPSTSGVEYNSFEMPQVVAVDGGDMDNTHFDLGSELTVNNAFYSNQQPSTSGQLTDLSDQTVNLHNHNQLINENGQYIPQAEVILHQMEPSTSYAQQINPNMDNDQMIGMDQQMGQQSQQQQQQQQFQQQPQQVVKAPAKKSKPNNRKKQQANNTVGAVLTKVNKIAQGGPTDGGGGTRLETRMTAEESARIGQLMNEIARLQEEMAKGVDHSERINMLQSEFSSIFAKNLSQSSTTNTDIFSQIQSLTGAGPSQQAPQQQQLQQQQQQQQQPQQQHVVQAPKKPAPKRNRNQQNQQNRDNMQQLGPTPQQPQPQHPHPKIGPPKLSEEPIAVVVSSSGNGMYGQQPDSPVYQPQIVYQSISSEPSTSAEYDFNNQEVHIVNKGTKPGLKIPQMNQRTHVYRQQAVIYSSNEKVSQVEEYQGQTVYDGEPIMLQNQTDNQLVMTSVNEPTIGEVLSQQLKQTGSDGIRGLMSPNKRRRASAAQVQPQQQQQQQQQVQQISEPQKAVEQIQEEAILPETIEVTQDNHHMFPGVAIGSVLALEEEFPDDENDEEIYDEDDDILEEDWLEDHQLIDGLDEEFLDELIKDEFGDSFVIDQQMNPEMDNPGGYPEETIEDDDADEEDDENPDYDEPEPTADQVSAMVDQKREERRIRIAEFRARQIEMLENPDTETPFRDVEDVIDRLLPYHLLDEPEVAPAVVEDFDDNWLRYNINLGDRLNNMSKRIQSVCLKQSYKHSYDSEVNLLKFLDTEYEKRRLANEKEEAAEDLDGFIEKSSIVKAFREGKFDPDNVTVAEAPEPYVAPPTFERDPIQDMYNDFEYNEFDEDPTVVSPFMSPVLTGLLSPKKKFVEVQEEEEEQHAIEVEEEPVFEAFTDEDSPEYPPMELPIEFAKVDVEPTIHEEVLIVKSPIKEFIVEPVEEVITKPVEKMLESVVAEQSAVVSQSPMRTTVELVKKQEEDVAVEKSMRTTEITTVQENIPLMKRPDNIVVIDEKKKKDEVSVPAPKLKLKKELFTRLRTASPETIAPISLKIKLGNQANGEHKPKNKSPEISKKGSSSTAETFEDSDGSASPELGLDDMEEDVEKNSLEKLEKTPEPPKKPILKLKAPPPIKLAIPKVKIALPKVASKEIVEDDIILVPHGSEESRGPIKLKIKLGVPKMTFKQEEPDADVSTPQQREKSPEVVVVKESSPEIVAVKKPTARKRKSSLEKAESKKMPDKKRMKLDAEKLEVPKEISTPNGALNDRLLRVMTDDINGRIRIKFRRLTPELEQLVTPRRMKEDEGRKELSPSLNTRLKMKIRRSDVGCFVNVVETKHEKTPERAQEKVVPVLNGTKVNGTTNGKIRNGTPAKAFARMTDKSKQKEMSAERKRMKMEVNGAKKAKPTKAFCNKFNPFTSITTPSTPATTSKPILLQHPSFASIPSMVSTPKTMADPIPAISAPILTTTPKIQTNIVPRKITALIGVSSSAEKKVKDGAATSNKMPIEPIILPETKEAVAQEESLKTPLKSQHNDINLCDDEQQERSPRASSALALNEFFGDKSVINLLASPQSTSDPLPAVDFSDDDENDLQHSNLSSATDRIIALSTSQSNQ